MHGYMHDESTLIPQTSANYCNAIKYERLQCIQYWMWLDCMCSVQQLIFTLVHQQRIFRLQLSINDMRDWCQSVYMISKQVGACLGCHVTSLLSRCHNYAPPKQFSRSQSRTTVDEKLDTKCTKK